MGRKSRRKLERRLGLLQPTRKEAERARRKGERRARHVQPTVEEYERIAARGPARLIETLLGRHSTRIDNLPAALQLSMDRCLTHLLSIYELDTVYADRGASLAQLHLPHESPWPTHLAWSMDSAVTAIRLILVGQVAGAAIVLRQQLGRWTVLLAMAASSGRRPHEPIESFIARAWTQRAMRRLSRYTADVAVHEKLDDLGDEPRTTGFIERDHEHVQIDGDRAICPASVYHGLCELIEAKQAEAAVGWEALHNLDPERPPPDACGAADALSDALALCIIQMRLAAAAVCEALGDPDKAEEIRTMSAPEERFAHCASETQLLLRKSPVARLTPALVPLVRTELAESLNIDYAAKLYTDYHNVLAARSHTQRYTRQELAKLAFAAHRYSRFLLTEAAHAQDLKLSDKHLHIAQHFDHMSPYVVTAEFAALCARWNQPRSEIAAAAMLISSTLRSGYWLWLEEDDRAMGILRCTLHQAARLRTWHINADVARTLETVSLTTPRDWMNAAGWSKFRSLDRALFEFAHANRDSGADAAEILLEDRHNDAGSAISLRLARRTALDKVTALAASETIKFVAAQQSPAIADAMREALLRAGLDIQMRRARRQPSRRGSPRLTAQGTVANPGPRLTGQRDA
ncbi:hypothetical protein X425_01498 [Mycobacterium rhizamassiliense]|uniref:Uncharacterized protein n=2 Tax=Mycobacterium rhizamassiliense TaxID=1841860 RepID=A0A2U3NL69_9MYCO|nr:hypothetical protein X425_01498 [Mycobacterium rhizamassiliense]